MAGPAGYGDQSIFDAGGNPYGTSQTGSTIDEPTRKAIAFQAKQMAAVADKLR